MEKYNGIKVIEFHDWNNWFKDGRVDIKDLNKKCKFYDNMGIVLKGDDCKEHGIVKGDQIVRSTVYNPCNISPKNTEQTIALELLRDDSIKLVTILGAAGSGKTLLACAHALHQYKKNNIAKIVIAKSLTPVGRDIGYLKGTMNDKMMPWLGPFKDNFIHCDVPYYQMEKMIQDDELEITPITFIQGRSISNAIIIIDEAQNLDANILKQIISRAGEGTKVIVLGDPSQVFEKLVNPGLETIVEKGKDSSLVGHIRMQKSLRSDLAAWAVENL